MIGEKYFIENYSFFWNSTLPMANFFLRKVNLDLLQNNETYLESTVYGRRRSYLSQVAFQVFVDEVNKLIKIEESDTELIRIIEEKCRNQFKNYKEEDFDEITGTLSNYEIVEVLELANRLNKFLIPNHNISITTSPKFKGCGFLNSCFGDVIIDDTLYEIKMVERNFHSIDCKQILTYCALNYLSKDFSIRYVCMYNPRRGTHFKLGLNEFSLMISGKSSSELLSEIIEFISGGGVSK